MNQWFCIAGREKELSAAELWSRLVRLGSEPHLERIEDAIVISGKLPETPAHLLTQLGGCLKIGRLVFQCSEKELEGQLRRQVFESGLVELADRVVFGLSAAGRIPADAAKRTQVLGLQMKKELISAGYTARLVHAGEAALSSVSVEKNDLIQAGGEIVLIFNGQKTVQVGQTLAVQDFESYSQRDYDRPGRSMSQGMLPPKLAQIMINLAQVSETATLLDPFCGSGTVLQEAALLGYTRLIGTDLDQKAIRRTRENWSWLQRHYPDRASEWRIEKLDATKLSQSLPLHSVDAIVSEGDLGPIRLPRSTAVFHRLRTQLEEMYTLAIGEFARVLAAGGRVVLAIPRWYEGKQSLSVELATAFERHGFQAQQFPPELIRQPLRYHRAGQRVGRDIVVYTKKK